MRCPLFCTDTELFGGDFGNTGSILGTLERFLEKRKSRLALFLISLFVIVYGCIAVDYEIGKDWKGHESVQNVLKDISTFIPVGAAVVGMIIGVIPKYL